MKKAWILAIFGMAAVGLAASLFIPYRREVKLMSSGSWEDTEPAQSNPKLFLDGFFVIGVFSQPANSFDTWKSRGINTLLEVPMNHDANAWDRAAQQAGMKIIRRPLSNSRADIGRKDLLAWSHWDEPDAAGRIKEWTPAFEKTYAEWKAIDPNRKVFLNFAGPDLTWFTTRQDAYSKEYSSYYPRLVKVTDWVAADIYPCGGWLNEAHKVRRGDIRLIAEPIKALKELTDKPIFAFIETSEVELGNVPGARCPTPDEVRAEIWEAIIHGARGIFYFPAVVGKRGFQFDGTPTAIVSEITKQNQVISQLSNVLQSRINPSEFGIQANAPLEACWRYVDGTAYFFVLNTLPQKLSVAKVGLAGVGNNAQVSVLGENRTLTLSDGVLLDRFEPYVIHIYAVKTK